MDTLEFHLWGSHVDTLEQPDLMVFDLDPDEGMDLGRVRQGVRDVKSVLDEMCIRDSHLDAGITVFSTATPRFVEIAEQGVRRAEGPIENYTSLASKVYIRPAFQEIAREYLEPLRRCDIDTLVLGCTHFPLLKALIGGVVGRDVTLLSSAREAARDVSEILARRQAFAAPGHVPCHCLLYTYSCV